jgi:tetratricopeptide (TPR) repeat protein
LPLRIQKTYYYQSLFYKQRGDFEQASKFLQLPLKKGLRLKEARAELKILPVLKYIQENPEKSQGYYWLGEEEKAKMELKRALSLKNPAPEVHRE